MRPGVSGNISLLSKFPLTFALSFSLFLSEPRRPSHKGPIAGDAQGAGAAVGGDDAAGGDERHLPEAQVSSGLFHQGLQLLREAGGDHRPELLPLQAVLLGVLPDEPGGDLFQLTPVLFRHDELPVQDVHAGDELQQVPRQSRHVADPSAGPGEVQVPGDEGHPGAVGDPPGEGGGLLHGPLRVPLQLAGHGDDHGALAGGDLFCVQSGDIVPVLGGHGGGVEGAGGDGGVGQVQDLRPRLLPVDPVKGLPEVLRVAAAGLGDLSGAPEVLHHVLRGEMPVVPGLLPEGDVHGHDLDPVLPGQLRGHVRPGLRHQNDLSHVSLLSGAGNTVPLQLIFKKYTTF